MREIKFKVYKNNKVIPEDLVNKMTLEELNKSEKAEYTDEIDKNGIEIYEGDICTVKGPYLNGICTVIKEGSGFQFKSENNVCLSVSMLHEYAEIIGNIYGGVKE